MAKKSSGKSYTSKGERKNVSNATRAAMRASRPASQKQLDILNEWKKGKNPWITIENPNKNETNKRFIKIRLSDMKGTYKEAEKKFFMA